MLSNTSRNEPTQLTRMLAASNALENPAPGAIPRHSPWRTVALGFALAVISALLTSAGVL